MYHVLDLIRFRVQALGSDRNFFVHLQNRTRLNPCHFFDTVRFFSKIFQCLQRVAFQLFYEILQQTGFSKSPKGPLLSIFGIVRFFKTIIFHLKFWLAQWISIVFVSGYRKRDLRDLTSLKGTLRVFRNCFLSFSLKRPGHILRTLRFLSLRCSADF